MSETQPASVVKEDPRRKQLQDIQAVRDLFARAHDYIAQAQYPGHMGASLAEVLNFLKFQYGDFKQRVETLEKQLKSEVDAAAAKAQAEAALAPQPAVVAPAQPASTTPDVAPKA